jgi:O-methyltransferase involved in polyketide biosynthesis
MSPGSSDPDGRGLWVPNLGAPPSLQTSSAIDTTVAHSARIWNYWLGGKDNYAIDRQIGDRVQAILPSIVTQARADRAFLGRAVRYLTGEHRIRQFLDIGTGLPTAENTHQVAQRSVPESRVVYVDNDPVVLAHAQALLTSTPHGACDYVQADLHQPHAIVHAASRTLDFAQPIAVMLLGIVHHITDTDEAHAIVQHLVEAVPPGSFLAINHATNAVHKSASEEAAQVWNRFGKPPITLRTPAQITDFFTGLELTEPGVVSCSQWRPEARPWGDPEPVDEFCGIARKQVTRTTMPAT